MINDLQMLRTGFGPTFLTYNVSSSITIVGLTECLIS